MESCLIAAPNINDNQPKVIILSTFCRQHRQELGAQSRNWLFLNIPKVSCLCNYTDAVQVSLAWAAKNRYHQHWAAAASFCRLRFRFPE